MIDKNFYLIGGSKFFGSGKIIFFLKNNLNYSYENFIVRGTKPLGKDEQPWKIAYVDLEAFCECTKDDRKKAFKIYEGSMT